MCDLNAEAGLGIMISLGDSVLVLGIRLVPMMPQNTSLSATLGRH